MTARRGRVDPRCPLVLVQGVQDIQGVSSEPVQGGCPVSRLRGGEITASASAARLVDSSTRAQASRICLSPGRTHAAAQKWPGGLTRRNVRSVFLQQRAQRLMCLRILGVQSDQVTRVGRRVGRPAGIDPYAADALRTSC